MANSRFKQVILLGDGSKEGARIAALSIEPKENAANGARVKVARRRRIRGLYLTGRRNPRRSTLGGKGKKSGCEVSGLFEFIERH